MENGDLGDIGSNLIILVPIVLVILFNIVLKKRRGEKTQAEIALSLLADVTQNQRIVEAFIQQSQVKKFRTDSWQRNRGKAEFLEPELREDLADTFGMAEEFNRAIDAARKYKSSSYLEGIPVDRLKESLDWSRQELAEWVQLNHGQNMMGQGRGGFSSP